MPKVDLDAMIRREDFLVRQGSNADPGKPSVIRIGDLIPSAGWYGVLRKPLFQRVTDEWDSMRICDFIISFLDKDFIPPIIMWPSPSGFNFVIDGSHRLGTLLAWTHDDYGDGRLSQDFYGLEITDDQRKAAEKTRKLVNNTVGSYADLSRVFTTNDSSIPIKLERSRRLQSAQLETINVTGPPQTAESSFIKINDSAAKINKTERMLIETRDQASTIAARAIVHAGTGYEYWSAFDEATRNVVKRKAKAIYDGLFKPPYESPVYDVNLPLAGRAFSGHSLALVRDFVNIANGIEDHKQKGKVPKLKADVIQKATLSCLQKCESALNLINAKGSGNSLGIHPTFYVYTADGRLKPGSFYAVVSLVIEMERNGKLGDFTKVRKRFEEAIEKYDYLIQQIVRYYRSAFKSYPYVKTFYLSLIRELSHQESTLAAVKTAADSMGINLSMKRPEKKAKRPKRRFDRETKSEVFLDIAKKTVPQCSHCGGWLHKFTITLDHDKRKREGGFGTKENANLAHPYCNSVEKN